MKNKDIVFYSNKQSPEKQSRESKNDDSDMESSTSMTEGDHVTLGGGDEEFFEKQSKRNFNLKKPDIKNDNIIESDDENSSSGSSGHEIVYKDDKVPPKPKPVPSIKKLQSLSDNEEDSGEIVYDDDDNNNNNNDSSNNNNSNKSESKEEIIEEQDTTPKVPKLIDSQRVSTTTIQTVTSINTIKFTGPTANKMKKANPRLQAVKSNEPLNYEDLSGSDEDELILTDDF